MLTFKPASKDEARARVAIYAPSGAGKTMTMLKMLRAFVGPEGRFAVIDSEHGSASKYVGVDEIGDFDVLELEGDFSPEVYADAIKLAAKAGVYDALGIDSLSHVWSGSGGALEIVDNQAAMTRSGDKHGAWRIVTPMMTRLIETIISSPLHIVATMRAKTDTARENGKIVKLGLAPIMRDGIEYEFDVVATMNLSHELSIEKTRVTTLDGKVFKKPGADVAEIIKSWLSGADSERREEAISWVRGYLLDTYGEEAALKESAFASKVSGGAVGDVSKLTTPQLLGLKSKIETQIEKDKQGES